MKRHLPPQTKQRLKRKRGKHMPFRENPARPLPAKRRKPLKDRGFNHFTQW